MVEEVAFVTCDERRHVGNPRFLHRLQTVIHLLEPVAESFSFVACLCCSCP